MRKNPEDYSSLRVNKLAIPLSLLIIAVVAKKIRSCYIIRRIAYWDYKYHQARVNPLSPRNFMYLRETPQNAYLLSDLEYYTAKATETFLLIRWGWLGGNRGFPKKNCLKLKKKKKNSCVSVIGLVRLFGYIFPRPKIWREI